MVSRQTVTADHGLVKPSHRLEDRPLCLFDHAAATQLMRPQIPVPSSWECEGHGTPMYTNIQYPWPVDPPFVAADNPTGCYLRRFDLPDDWSAAEQRCEVALGALRTHSARELNAGASARHS